MRVKQPGPGSDEQKDLRFSQTPILRSWFVLQSASVLRKAKHCTGDGYLFSSIITLAASLNSSSSLFVCSLLSSFLPLICSFVWCHWPRKFLRLHLRNWL